MIFKTPKKVYSKGRVLERMDTAVLDRLYLSTGANRVIAEINGRVDFGRPKSRSGEKKKSETVWLGSYRDNFNIVNFWKDLSGIMHMTVKGGMHPVTFEFENSHKKKMFLLRMAKAMGYSVFKHGSGHEIYIKSSKYGEGGYSVYIGKK